MTSPLLTTRIEKQFARLKAQKRAALVTYVMAGDPDYATALEIIKALPQAGSDLIELGMPFSDPMADGPDIQAAAQRALQAGQTLTKTLELVQDFRTFNDQTPILLMGYYNPIYRYGVSQFLQDAQKAGIDGLLVVDLPPEMDEELCLPALSAGLNFIRLATPTTDEKRLPKVLENTSGFVYYVSMTGITGRDLSDVAHVAHAVATMKQHTNLPVAVGFGISRPEQVAEIGKIADGVVVGSALVRAIAATLDGQHRPSPTTVEAVAALVRRLRDGLN